MEDWIVHRNDFLELCDNNCIKEEVRMQILRHTIMGKEISSYRTLMMEGGRLDEHEKTFKNCFLTEARSE